jgi:hypothetical protein
MDLQMRVRAAGTDASGSNYTRQSIFGFSTTIGTDTATGTSLVVGAGSTTSGASVINVFGPQLAASTNFVTTGGRQESIKYTTGVHTLSTAYDGFTIFPTSGTVTGKISVYGYRK